MADNTKGKRGKRVGAHQDTYNAYRSSGKQEQNKALKLARYIKDHPKDDAARAALLRLPDKFVNEATKKYGVMLKPTDTK